MVFLHEVTRGAADRSYGIQVAKLAGLPASVIDRAQTVLAGLEQSETLGRVGANRLADDLPLFTATRLQSSLNQENTEPSPLEQALADIVPDSLTPHEALDLIYRLKADIENT